MKLDQAAIDKAITDDPVVQSIERARAQHLKTDADRRAQVRIKADALWSQAGELRRQAHNLQQKAQKLSRRLAVRRGPLTALAIRRKRRIKTIISRLEEQYLRDQRLAFRKAHGLR